MVYQLTYITKYVYNYYNNVYVYYIESTYTTENVIISIYKFRKIIKIYNNFLK